MDKVKEAIIALSDEKLIKAKNICEIIVRSIDLHLENNTYDPFIKPTSARTLMNLECEIVATSSIEMMSPSRMFPLNNRKFMIIEVEGDYE